MKKENAMQSTDYSHEFEGKFLRIHIGTVETTAMIEFFVDNKLVYYKPINEPELKTISDIRLIASVISAMKTDKSRWLDMTECQWIVNNFKNSNYLSRTAIYKFHLNKDADMVVNLIEEKDKRTRIYLKNEQGKGKITCDFEISKDADIIELAQLYASAMLEITNIFDKNRPEIAKPTLERNILVETKRKTESQSKKEIKGVQ